MQIWRRDGAEWRRRRVAVNEFYEVLDRRQFPHTLKMRPKRKIFLLNLKKKTKTKKNSVDEPSTLFELDVKVVDRDSSLIVPHFFFIAKNRRDSTIDVVIEEQKGIAANERKRPPIAKKKKRKTTKNRSATVDWLLTGGREPIAVRPLLSTDILYFFFAFSFLSLSGFLLLRPFLGRFSRTFFFSFVPVECVRLFNDRRWRPLWRQPRRIGSMARIFFSRFLLDVFHSRFGLLWLIIILFDSLFIDYYYFDWFALISLDYFLFVGEIQTNSTEMRTRSFSSEQF